MPFFGIRSSGTELIFAKTVFRLSTPTLQKFPESSLTGTRLILTKLGLACSLLKNSKNVSETQTPGSTPPIVNKLFELLKLQKSACIDFQHREYFRNPIIETFFYSVSRILLQFDPKKAVKSIFAILTKSKDVYVSSGLLLGLLESINEPYKPQNYVDPISNVIYTSTRGIIEQFGITDSVQNEVVKHLIQKELLENLEKVAFINHTKVQTLVYRILENFDDLSSENLSKSFENFEKCIGSINNMKSVNRMLSTSNSMNTNNNLNGSQSGKAQNSVLSPNQLQEVNKLKQRVKLACAIVQVLAKTVKTEEQASQLAERLTGKFIHHPRTIIILLNHPLIVTCFKVLTDLAKQYPAICDNVSKKLMQFLVGPSTVMIKLDQNEGSVGNDVYSAIKKWYQCGTSKKGRIFEFCCATFCDSNLL